MSSLIGSVGPFNESEETFELYLNRVESFFLANDIGEAKKVHVFLSLVGKDTYKLITDLLSPTQPNTVTALQDITNVLKLHYKPQVNVIYERFKFNKRDQADNETNTEYIAALKSLASKCEFGAKLQEYLRDRLVAGISDEATQRVLLAMKDLTLDQATEMAFAREAAAKDSSAMHQAQKPNSAETHAINTFHRNQNYNQNKGNKYKAKNKNGPFNNKSKPKEPNPKFNNNSETQSGQPKSNSNKMPRSLCNGCRARHWRSECPFLHSTCTKCGKQSHIAKVCYYRNSDANSTHTAETANDQGAVGDTVSYSEYNFINHTEVTKPIHITL